MVSSIEGYSDRIKTKNYITFEYLRKPLRLDNFSSMW